MPWGSSDLSFVSHIYPPLPVLVAEVLRSSLALGIAGAVLGGTILEVVGRRLYRLHFPLPVVCLLVATLGASPSFAQTTTTDLRSLLTLALLATAIEGFLRFVLRGRTHAGFTAGMAIGLAGLCDPFALVCAVGFGLAAPVVALHRFRGRRAAVRATVSVLLFPTVAGIAAWCFLTWRFTGNGVAWLHDAAPNLWFGHGVGTQLTQALHAVWSPLWHTPLYLLALALLLWRRTWLTAITAVLPLAVVVVALWLGFPVPPTAVALLLGIMALVALPPRPTRTMLVLVCAVALAGMALKWGTGASGPVLAWEHSLG